MLKQQGSNKTQDRRPGKHDEAKADHCRIDDRRVVNVFLYQILVHRGVAHLSGPDFDTAFGLAHTIEKAAELYIAARAANGGSDKFLNVISDQGLKDTCRDFGIQINEDFVD